MFMFPIFLAGALLAVIPVVIHLFFHRRAPQVPFSTIRFLQMCVRKTARRKRIENLLLLVFRMLLFGLLAVALAKPFFRSELSGGSGPVSTVIVLDNSYSMDVSHEGTRRFETAQRLAEDLVRGMSEGDRVALILTGGAVGGREPELVNRLNEVRAAIRETDIYEGPTNLVGKINEAYKLIADSDDVNREIVVITDLQKNALDGKLSAQALAADDVPLLFYDCGRAAPPTLALTDLTLKGGGWLGGGETTLEVEVLNPTDAPVDDARVTLYIRSKPADAGADDARVTLDVESKAVLDEPVSVAPHARTTVRLKHRLDPTRSVTGWVQLAPDALERDNSYYFRVGALGRIEALVLREEQAPIPYLDDAFYLFRALDPSGAEASVSPVKPHLRLAAELDRIVLGDYRVVFLVNLRTLDAAVVRKLRRYVETGGMVVCFLGDRVIPGDYAAAFKPDGSGLFPARLGRALGDATRRTASWRMDAPRFEGSDMTRLKAIAPTLFERVRAYRFFPITEYDPAKVNVLASLSSDKHEPASAPLVVSAPLGKGEVTVFTVPATTEWTNFPATKVFVPMVHELVYAIAGRASRLDSIVVGQPRDFDFGDVSEPVTVKVEVRPDLPVVLTSLPKDGNTVSFNVDLDRPGFYPYTLSGAREGSDYFVVNRHTEESVLDRMTDDEVKGQFAGTRFVLARTPEEFETERRRLREGHPLSGYVFLLLIAVAAMELFMANRTRPAGAAAASSPLPPGEG